MLPAPGLTVAGANTPGGYLNANGQLVDANGNPYNYGAAANASGAQDGNASSGNVSSGRISSGNGGLLAQTMNQAANAWLATPKGTTENFTAGPGAGATLVNKGDGTADYTNAQGYSNIIMPGANGQFDFNTYANEDPGLAAQWQQE